MTDDACLARHDGAACAPLAAGAAEHIGGAAAVIGAQPPPAIVKFAATLE